MTIPATLLRLHDARGRPVDELRALCELTRAMRTAQRHLAQDAPRYADMLLRDCLREIRQWSIERRTEGVMH